jgi:hypothetical protein
MTDTSPNPPQELPNQAAQSLPTIPLLPVRPARRIRMGLLATLFGFLIFLIGARPSLFVLDRSPVVGFVQIAVFLVGLALICLGGYTAVIGLWHNRQRSIAADIGTRLVATGYVITVFTGMADIFGFGSQHLPRVPYFGPLQAIGVQIGQLVIAIGFLLMMPYRHSKND